MILLEGYTILDLRTNIQLIRNFLVNSDTCIIKSDFILKAYFTNKASITKPFVKIGKNLQEKYLFLILHYQEPLTTIIISSIPVTSLVYSSITIMGPFVFVFVAEKVWFVCTLYI